MTTRATVYAYRIAFFILGSFSIGSLLLYFFGIGSFKALATTLLSAQFVGLTVSGIYAHRAGHDDAKRILTSGIWAGCLATLVYDVVRIPIAHSGIPVFKAISYFGTVFVGVERPTVLSEIVGWTYHLSNGVSFALMYAALVLRPTPISAMAWGLSLECAMLLTPYAEVFGYQRDLRFFAITVGSHAAYGLALWLGLRGMRGLNFRLRPVHYGLGFAVVPLSLVLIAADSHRIYAANIPQSPPAYVGTKLYTVWNVPEPDRVSVIWVMNRFVDTGSQFYFIEPFDRIKFGRPLDTPEAEIRRHGTQSATEFLISERKVMQTPKLQALSRMTNLTEVTPWALAGDAEAGQLAEFVRGITAKTCGQSLRSSCLESLLEEMDRWYAEKSQ
jgi:hypothetical protein